MILCRKLRVSGLDGFDYQDWLIETPIAAFGYELGPYQDA